MKIFQLALLAFVGSLNAFGVYTYDYSATPPANNPSQIQASNITYQPTFASLTGELDYVGPIAGPNPNDYDVSSTFLPNGNNVSYTHYLRRSSQGYVAVVFGITNPYSNSYYACSLKVTQLSNSVQTTLASSSYDCSLNGPNSFFRNQTLRTIVHGTELLVFWNGTLTYDLAVPLGSGTPSFFAFPTVVIYELKIGHLATAAPSAVGSVKSSLAPNRASLQWSGSADDPSGPGIFRYDITQNGTTSFTSSGPDFDDNTVSPSSSYSYTIVAETYHGAKSAPITVNLTTPMAGAIDPRRPGVRPTGAYWGALGEQIDLLSGNLSYNLPLVNAKGRGNWGVSFALSYNSQNWRNEDAATWRLGGDVGYGFGWRLLAGSVTPFWKDEYTISHYLFTDSTGAEYRLSNQSNGVWSSSEGIYVWFDSNTDRLHFKDGSFWIMGCTSGGTEDDAGTLYPTVMQDSNGNQVIISYQTGQNAPFVGNSSARIVTIEDVRAVGTPPVTYTFNYSTLSATDPFQHLQSITNSINTPESYSFNYSAASLNSPFTPSANYGQTYTLGSVNLSSTGSQYGFQYDAAGAGELTRVGLPDGGYLNWAYASYTYSGNRTLREVISRSLGQFSNSSPWSYSISHSDSANPNSTVHNTTTLDDASGAEKVWTFATSNTQTPAWETGLATQLQNNPSMGGPSLRTDVYTWATGPGDGNPYIATTTKTYSPGTSYQAAMTASQTVDQYGNVLQYQIFDYNSPNTALRTYRNVWQHSVTQTSNFLYGGNYDYLYLRNLLSSKTATGASGNVATLVSNTYDGSSVAAVSGAREWDSTLGGLSWASAYRGNLTASVTPSGTSRFAFDATGHSLTSVDANGSGTAATYSTTTNFAVPDMASPKAGTTVDTSNGNTSSQTSGSLLSVAYTYDTALNTLATSLPNGAVATQMISPTTGLVQSSISVHGATTNYIYSFNPTSVTATTNGHWSKTLLDGLGHTISTQSGTGGEIVSETDTVYGPCACSPDGKIVKVSQPYGVLSSGVVTTSDGTGQRSWTQYSYDGLGRTLTSTASDGSVTQYIYQGNTTKVIDPAGNWKKYTADALGNLTKVIEPNPQYGQADNNATNFVTTYSYDAYNHLTSISMSRPYGSGTYTQVRTYSYDPATGRLSSQTMPESGTTSYTYYPSGRVASTTDAKGQETDYSYDVFGRLEYVDKFIGSSTSGTYDACHSSQLIWDTTSNATNGLGRVSSVKLGLGNNCQFGSVSEVYRYSQGGLTTAKEINVATAETPYPLAGYGMQYPYANGGFGVSYTYDNEGRQTSYSISGQNGAVNYTLDSVGRAIGMTESASSPVPWVKSAAYGPAGELQRMTYLTSAGGAYQETRTYNKRLQLTNISSSGPGLQGINLSYSYMAGSNNGQVSQMTDNLSGEQIAYTYDSLKRLAKAEAIQDATQYPNAPKWGQSYTYDGWGNMTAKAPTAVGPATNFTVSVDPNTNRISSSGFSYDANGNMTNMPGLSQTLTYDTSNRISGAIYDRENEPVYKNGVWYLYDPSGRRLATYTLTLNCQWTPSSIGTVEQCWYINTLSSRNIYFGGRLIQSNGKTVLVDRVGSVRANENAETFEYYPYGDEITVKNPQDREKFATYTRDSMTGLDYAVNRWHMPGWGRFASADRYKASAGPDEPGSWNRFAYVGGDPINYTDPGGLIRLNCNDLVDGFVQIGCESGGVDDNELGGNATCSYDAFGVELNPFCSEDQGVQGPEEGNHRGPNDGECKLVAPGGNYRVGPNAVALFQPLMADALTNAFNVLNLQGITPTINSGYRSPFDQARMQNGGSGPNPAALISWHQVGMAVDINGTTSSFFPSIISAMQAQGLTWGGTFRHRDPPHFQLPRAGTSPTPAMVSACGGDH